MNTRHAITLAIVLATLLVVPGHAAQVSAQESRCYCFSWVHGDDFGTTCRNTRAACEAAGRASRRDHSPCTEHLVGGHCSDHGRVGGRHYRRENVREN